MRINLNKEAPIVAKQLIGWQLFVCEADDSHTGGIIVETEAYTAGDMASHSFHGKTERNRVMFGPAGRMYVYFSYGLHWCMNIVTGPEGTGDAVLIRALLPTSNVPLMRARRGDKSDSILTNGPAKVCQALGVTGNDNGAPLEGTRFLLLPPNNQTPHIATASRIGISKDTHRLWRFYAVEIS